MYSSYVFAIVPPPPPMVMLFLLLLMSILTNYSVVDDLDQDYFAIEAHTLSLYISISHSLSLSLYVVISFSHYM